MRTIKNIIKNKEVGDIPNEDTIKAIKQARSNKELEPIADLSSWLNKI